jgi:predicted phosphodiesterase
MMQLKLHRTFHLATLQSFKLQRRLRPETAMKFALISDVHANLPAFEACLAKCGEQGVDQFVIMGDIVGYGPDPEAVTQRVMELAARGASVILGNHDEAIFANSPNMHEAARAAIEWTKQRLSVASINFLRQLPLTAEFGGALAVHSEASQPARWNYVTCAAEAHRSLTATTARVTFCGHVHVPQLYCLTATAKVISHTPVTGVAIPLLQQRRWLAVIGSAGQPRDGNPAAAFATFDASTRELVYRRAPYDVEATAERMRKLGLPERLAQRLFIGH